MTDPRAARALHSRCFLCGGCERCGRTWESVEDYPLRCDLSRRLLGEWIDVRFLAPPPDRWVWVLGEPDRGFPAKWRQRFAPEYLDDGLPGARFHAWSYALQPTQGCCLAAERSQHQREIREREQAQRIASVIDDWRTRIAPGRPLLVQP